MISSTVNAKIKYIKRLQTDARFRRRQGFFVVEGTRWLRELAAQQHQIHLALYTEAWHADGEHAALLSQAPVESLPVTEQVMRAVSDMETPPGILCVVPMTAAPPAANSGLILIVDGMQNPGNMGSLLRTAAAAGVDEVLLAPGCVDAYAPKVVRGAMGAHLRVARKRLNWQQIAQRVEGMNLFLADAGGETAYWDVDWTNPTALIVSNEAHGAGMEAQSLAGARICIPMSGDTESLNATVAAGVVLFEAARQRAAAVSGR